MTVDQPCIRGPSAQDVYASLLDAAHRRGSDGLGGLVRPGPGGEDRCGGQCSLEIDHVGQVDQDWVTRGAHVNMKDGMEVAVRPDGQGGIRGEEVWLRNGTATQKQVDAVVATIKSDPRCALT
ncbi:hypothetical protein ACWCQ0_26845 [Streptomyces massasporeus]|uniref:hypothetical protein n=1 Tax=Streptomyces massasporeus TaxID=67324 RepID=UPI0033CFC271